MGGMLPPQPQQQLGVGPMGMGMYPGMMPYGMVPGMHPQVMHNLQWQMGGHIVSLRTYVTLLTFLAVCFRLYLVSVRLLRWVWPVSMLLVCV